MISLLREPFTYSPAGNPISFKFSSSYSTMVYFQVKVIEAVTSDVIINLNVFPMPTSPTTGTIDLSRVLQSTVKTKVDNYIAPFAVGKSTLGYKLVITERGLIGGVMSNLTTPTTLSSTYYVWDGQLDNLNYSLSLGANTHVIIDSNPAKFLTLQPQYKKVNAFSFEQLYFMNHNQSTLYMVVSIYRNGSIVFYSDYTISSANVSKLWKINVSPKSWLSFGIASSHVWQDGDTYSINIKDVTTNRTELRWYQYKDLRCDVEAVNIVWVNSLGGVDSYQFLQPVESVSTTKLSIQKNNLVDGSYLNDGIFNVSDSIYSSVGKSSIKVYTDSLRDIESKWLVELVNSKQCYIELSNSNMVPVSLVNTNYDVQRNRFVNGLTQVQFEFSFTSNTIPATSAGAGIKIN